MNQYSEKQTIYCHNGPATTRYRNKQSTERQLGVI